ncbi:AraC family transcriptional regulator [Bordetella genomosp. 5]|uniref:helix-turn-helix transcriptional regulator n=1 Tax=Bordetella genomosp. 5 TaxID=1395608 RepID=UPI000B9EA040|nr:helix-turn-helix domain-containing protein [Bordetella genomosp. 5]OZI43680.1 AraC family transcriptional regulator [Bordetella genomosp. 5]
MTRRAPLSSKLDLIAQTGFALAASRQPRYTFHWHEHDCAMLLWPRAGVLDTAWQDAGAARRRGRLVRGQALLLPSHCEHSTRAQSVTQQHGELYLAPELLRACGARGILQLDGAAQAMLDALWEPALSPRAVPSLVAALLAQLDSSRTATLAQTGPDNPALRWAASLRRQLQEGTPPSTVADAANTLGLSPRTVQRACLDVYGVSPVTLRRMLVAQAARERLALGESLARVSNELGFSSSGHLGRLLRAVDATTALPAALDTDADE